MNKKIQSQLFYTCNKIWLFLKNPHANFSYDWKKSFLLLFAAFFYTMSSILGQTTVTIGTGTSSTNLAPLNPYYNYNYSQQIYLNTEITGGGGVSGQNITKLRFYYSADAGTLSNINNWTVYVGNTTQATFTGTTNWIAIGSLTQVFSGIVSYPAVGNWLEITLSTAYTWNGNNLVVAIDENSGGYSNNISCWRYTSTSTNYRTIYYYSDGTNPNPSSPPTATGRTYNRPNIQLVMVTPCSAPTSITTSVTPSSSCNASQAATFDVTSSSGGNLNGGTWQYQWQEGATVLQAWSGTSSYATTLTGTKTYTVYMRSTACTGSVSSGFNATYTLNTAPSAAGTISGTATVCQGQNNVAYSVVAISGATSYTWAYTGSGATFSSNPSAAANITINFSPTATGGDLTVRGTNTCGNGTVSANYPITVNPLPAAAGTITGTASVCKGLSGVAYSVGAIGSATTYTWSYTGAGATFSSNPSAASNITINFSGVATSGDLTVRGTNACGNGTASANYGITLNAVPTAAPPASTNVCIGNSTVINGNPSGGSGTYSNHAWTISNAGGTGATGANLTNAGTQNVTFNAAALTAGTVVLQYVVTDNVGCSTTVTCNVVVGSPGLTLSNTGTPAMGNIYKGNTKVPLTGFQLLVGLCTTYNLTAVTITSAGTATVSDLSNFKIYLDANSNGAIDAGEVAVSNTLAYAASMVFTLFGEVNVSATRRYLLAADVVPSATAARTFTGSITAIGNITVVTNPVVAPSGTATGNAQTIIINDICANATSLTVGAAATSGDLTGAAGNAPTSTCGTVYLDTWYKFTTPCVGTYVVTVVGSASLDPVLTLYSNCTPTIVGSCADASGNGGTETVSSALAASTTYYIRVFSYTSAPSSKTFTVRVTSASAVTPSVSIAASANPACNGNNITFTATPTNGGTPSYQWKKNGVNVGANSATYNDATLVTNDVIDCIMTSSSCAQPNPVASNRIAMTVNPNVVPSVSIAITSGTNPTCSGTSVTFTATPTNGGGAPSYNFKVNGVSQQSGASATYSSSTLANGDAVTCVMTSNAPCPSPTTATSNTIAMTVNALPSAPGSAPSPSPASPVCSNSSQNFTFTNVTAGAGGNQIDWATNSGFSPLGGTVASGANSIVVNVASGASTTVYFRSKASGTGCVSSSSVSTVLTVNPLPSVPTSVTPSSATVICSGSSINLNATSAGNTIYWYTQSSGGSNIGSSASAANFSVTPPVGNTTYYAESYSPAGCTSSSRNSTALVTANASPGAPGVTNQARCSAGSVTFTATGAIGGEDYKWYSAPSGPGSGGSPTASGSGGTSNTTAYTGGTNISIVFPSIPAGAIVTSTTVTISFTANSPSWRSELRVEATPPAAVGGMQSDLQPSSTGSAGTVTNAPLGSWGTGDPAGTWLFRFKESADDGSVNPDANITNITITCNYTGTLLQTGGATYITPSLSITTTYYVTRYQTASPFCESSPRTPVTAIINVGGLNGYTATQGAQAYSTIVGGGGETAVTGWRSPNISLNGSSLSNSIPLPTAPAFNFPYDGGIPTSFLVSTNGFITFNTATKAKGDELWPSADVCGSTQQQPYTSDNTSFSGIPGKKGSLNMIAPFYNDLKYGDENTTVYYKTTGGSPNRIFTIEWSDVANSASCSGNGSVSYGSLNFQIKLYETSGNIEFLYGTMTQTTVGSCDGGFSLEDEFTCGINSSTLSASPTATQIFTQQTVNTGTFSSSPKNNLTSLPTANTKVLLTRNAPPGATGAPTCASTPYFPADAATNQCTNATISWTAGDQNPTYYNVYFGTDNPPTNILNGVSQTSVYLDPGALSPNTWYYWRAVPCNGIGCMPLASVPVRSFQTGPGNVPPTSLNSSAGTTFCPGTTSTISNVGGSISEGSNFIWQDGGCKGLWALVPFIGSTFQCSGTNDGGYIYNSPGTYYTDVYVSGCNATTTCTEITINVVDQIDPGTLDETGQTVCPGGDPSQVCFTADPSGGQASYNWQWYYKDGNNAAPTGTSTTGWTSIAGGLGTLTVINEHFDNAPTAPSGWTFTSIISNTSCYGNASPGVEYDATNDQILTTTYATAATKLEFFIAAKNSSFSNPGSLKVEGWNGSTWTQIDNFTVSADWLFSCNYTTKTYNLSIVSNYIRFRFTFTRTNGAIVMDDIFIRLGNTICYDPPSGLGVTRTYACMVDPTGAPDCAPFTWCGERYVVTMDPAPTPSATPKSSCSGSSAITMTGATAGGNISNASWSGGSGTWNNNGTAANPADDYFTPSSSYGSFTATLTVTSVCGSYGPAITTTTVTWADGAASYRTWVGAGAGADNWHTTTNWCSQVVPTSGIDALIQGGTPNNASVGTAAECKTITINSGATLTTSGSNNLDVYGDWNNSGTYNYNTGTISFRGGVTQNINSANTFYNLAVNETAGGSVTLNQPITVNKTLTLTAGNIITTPTNLLSMIAGSNVSGGSASSYVDGPMKKTGTTSFTFPVGNGGNYARIGFGVPTVSESFTAQYFKTGYGSYTMATSPTPVLNNISSLEYWTLGREGTANATVTLFSEDAAFSGITDCSNNDLRVAHFNTGTSKWENNNETGTAVTLSSGTCGTSSGKVFVVSGGNVTSFSPFTLGTKNGANPLPIELVYFSALCKDEISYINWTTATETNNDFFTLERSFDGLNFSQVSTIRGAGISATLLHYEYIDLIDNVSKESVVYYRLKQTDFDGKHKYSDVIATKCLEPEFELVTIMPNPTHSNFTVFYNSSSNKETVTFEVRDMIGRIIQSAEGLTKIGGNTMNIDISDAAPGVYFVIIKNNNASFIEKIIKN